MSNLRARHSRSHHERARFGMLPDDLYAYAYAYAEARPTPRIGQPVNHDPTGWTIRADWPDPLPVTESNSSESMPPRRRGWEPVSRPELRQNKEIKRFR